jgi:nucleoside-diphosphate-sugar epimerase
MSAIVITGAAGFIGSHLADYYLKKNQSVIGMDNFITSSEKNIEYLEKTYGNKFHFFEHDASTPWPYLSAELSHPKYIFHLASPASVKSYQKFPLETLRVNSIGLIHAIHFADSHKARLIFSSTSEIYGSPLTSPQKESDWGHVNSYGERSCYDEAKRFGEALIYSSNKINETTHGIVRIFNTYGPQMNPEDDRVLNSFIAQAMNGEDLVVFGDGHQTRSFCYIDDLVIGLADYAESDLNFPVNLGNSSEISINELAQKIIALTNSKSKIVYSELPQDDPPQRCPDLTLAKKHLSYLPQISLEDGIKKLIGKR